MRYRNHPVNRANDPRDRAVALLIPVHHLPHVHVKFGNEEAVIGIPRGELIEGDIPSRALRKVRAWIELNEEALMDRLMKGSRHPVGTFHSPKR